MKHLKLSLQSTWMCLLSLLIASSANAQITFSNAQQGVAAELIDQGDYYIHPDGSRINFYRKRDVFVVKSSATTSRKKSVDMATRLKSQFGNRVEFIRTSASGKNKNTVIKIDNQSKAKGAYRITPQMLKSLDSSILTTIDHIGQPETPSYEEGQ